jgi:epoxyqueuosine reductase QueG
MSADAQSLRTRIEGLTAAMGSRAFGVADLDGLRRQGHRQPPDVPPACTRAVVLGVRLQDAVLDAITDRPTPLYFHHYRQANYLLDRLALAAADCLQDAGFAALALPASQIVARDPLRGHASHRLLGWAAGLGRLGRSTLLVHPVHGARLRYVSVLTDAPLPADAPREGNCGECRRCVGACPARAIRERSEDFDVAACYAKLSEFVGLPFIGQHICGVCVKACRGKA